MFRKKAIPALLCVGLGSAGAAHATSVSYYLNESNVSTAPALADFTANFLKVTIDDEGAAGYINFTVSVLPALAGLSDTNFGIQSFAFNADPDSVLPPDCTGPGCAGWLMPGGIPGGWTSNTVNPYNAADGFGKFEVELSTSGTDRLSTLQFSFLSSGTPSSFVELSSGNAGQGNTYFAAHVAGFSTPDSLYGTTTSAYFGGELIAAVPVPAPLVLLGSALLPLVGFGKRRK